MNYSLAIFVVTSLRPLACERRSLRYLHCSFHAGGNFSRDR